MIIRRAAVRRPWYGQVLLRPECDACGWQGPLCGDGDSCTCEEWGHLWRCPALKVARVTVEYLEEDGL